MGRRVHAAGHAAGWCDSFLASCGVVLVYARVVSLQITGLIVVIVGAFEFKSCRGVSAESPVDRFCGSPRSACALAAAYGPDSTSEM